MGFPISFSLQARDSTVEGSNHVSVVRLPALRDNYIFLLVDAVSQTAAVVDPTLAEPIMSYLREQHLQLTAIFNTHHHHDHVGGNSSLVQHFPGIPVYGSHYDHEQARIPEQTVGLQAGDVVHFQGWIGQVLAVPGHTLGHIAYYFPTGHLFCGDTLFGGGCGRLFEGTPAQMLHSLAQLRTLPEETQVWCAHEYTLKNLEFAVGVDPNNPDLEARLQTVHQLRHLAQPTIPSQIGLEKRTNPFLRWDQLALQASMKSEDPVRVFGRLRGKRDLF
ncbi:MAG: hydroxyacylglutathione hydrolase [Cyanobacteriota bacterium]|nr:hydroxyacylglutathione hydrolase [Cyanobacteriota bacterium]